MKVYRDLGGDCFWGGVDQTKFLLRQWDATQRYSPEDALQQVHSFFCFRMLLLFFPYMFHGTGIIIQSIYIYILQKMMLNYIC